MPDLSEAGTGSQDKEEPVVLIDATAVPRDRGGVGRYVDGLLSELHGRIEIACQSRDAAHFKLIAPGATILPQPPGIASPVARLIWEQITLPILARRRNAAVIHSPHYTIPLLSGRPRVVTLHDATFFSDPDVHTRLKRTFFKLWTRVSSHLARAVIVPSAATAAEVARFTGPSGPVHVAHHGVDFTVFHRPSDADVKQVAARLGLGDAGWISFLGTLEPRKNLPALVRAYAAAAQARQAIGATVPTLVLAGGRGWDTTLDEEIGRVPAPGRVLSPGYIPLSELSALLGGSDLMVYPSLGEGFGLPVLEAMACGAAVLTTRRLSLPEVGGDAVAYCETDENSIAAEILALLDDPVRREELARLAEERARLFTWRACAAVHERVYREVASGKRIGRN